MEVKSGWIDAERIPGKISDRDTVLMMLDYVDTCGWGIVCGWMPEAHVKWQKDSSISTTTDRWFESNIQLPDGFSTSLVFGARLFARSSDRKRLEEILRAPTA